MRSVPTVGFRALTSRNLLLVGGALLWGVLQSAPAAEPAANLYRQCLDKPSTAEQRNCYPAVVRQSEIELAAAERKARARMVELEKISEGSRSMRPVLAFDRAARAFRAFRNAESNRVLASYGSGNGGDLATSAMVIDMNIARAKQLTGEADAR